MNLDIEFYLNLKGNTCVGGDRDYCCYNVGNNSKYIADLGYNNAATYLEGVLGSSYNVRSTTYNADFVDVGIVPQERVCGIHERFNCKALQACTIQPYKNEFCFAESFS